MGCGTKPSNDASSKAGGTKLSPLEQQVSGSWLLSRSNRVSGRDVTHPYDLALRVDVEQKKVYQFVGHYDGDSFTEKPNERVAFYEHEIMSITKVPDSTKIEVKAHFPDRELKVIRIQFHRELDRVVFYNGRDVIESTVTKLDHELKPIKREQ